MEMFIIYDYKNCEIHIPVRVESGLIWTPPVAIPQGQWRLLWELDEDSGKALKFCKPGVRKRDETLIPYLKWECKHKEIKDLCCPVTVHNSADQPNGCALDIHFDYYVLGLRFKHDPTIAVTPDPIIGDGSQSRVPAGAVLPLKA
jgi:hypothetical protein